MINKPDALVVGLSPAIQKTVVFDSFQLGEVNRSQYYNTDATGKCVNVCRVLTQGGKEASCLTIAGRENRVYFEELCSRDALHVSTIETTGRVRTCTTILDLEKNCCTELVVNEPELITHQEEEAFKQSFMKRMKENFACLIICGSKFEGFSDEIIPYMVREARNSGLLVIADFRGLDLINSFVSRTQRPDYVKINEEEFFNTFPDCDDLLSGIEEISEKYDCAMIITRGAQSTLVAEKGNSFEVDSKLIDAVNPIGCGDSMTAGLAQGLIEGLSLQAALELGRDYATKNALSIRPGSILDD